MSKEKYGKITIPAYCCPFDKQIVNKGKDDCDHQYPQEPNIKNDKCIHFICKNCNREVCYGIWD